MVRILLAALAVVSLARADTVSFTQSMADWSTGQALSFAKFDTAIGDLLDVRLNAAARVGRIMDFTGVDLPLFGMQATIENDFAIDAGMSGATWTYLYHDWGYDPYSASLGAFGRSVTIVDSTTYPIPLSNSWLTDLSRFTSGDPWEIVARGWTQTYLCSPIDACNGPNVLRDLSVTVHYDYAPTVATPEPRWSAALLVLFLMVSAKITYMYREPRP